MRSTKATNIKFWTMLNYYIKTLLCVICQLVLFWFARWFARSSQTFIYSYYWWDSFFGKAPDDLWFFFGSGCLRCGTSTGVAPLPPVLTIAVGVLAATVVVLLLGHGRPWLSREGATCFLGVLHNPLLNVWRLVDVKLYYIVWCFCLKHDSVEGFLICWDAYQWSVVSSLFLGMFREHVVFYLTRTCVINQDLFWYCFQSMNFCYSYFINTHGKIVGLCLSTEVNFCCS
jgi:hypothetical protein